MSGEPDGEYVSARKVLLDALDALAEHRSSVILVGSQAIYLNVAEDDIPVAPTTSDGDLVLDSRELLDEPKIRAVMEAAGFRAAGTIVGTWIGEHEVQIDLLVPAALSPEGRRGARLGAHGKKVARKARGLEATLVDNQTREIGALAPDDVRSFRVKVAGAGGLLVAKLHKLWDRREDEARVSNKDALDVLRLLRANDARELAITIKVLADDPVSGEVTREAVDLLRTLFGERTALGPELAAAATRGLMDEDEIRESCVALAEELLAALERLGR